MNPKISFASVLLACLVAGGSSGAVFRSIDAGPLTGTWNLKVVDTEYDGVNGKSSVEKSTIVATVSDEDAGSNSNVYLSIQDPIEGKIVLAGRRCGKAFAATHSSAFGTHTIAGTAALTKAGTCKAFVARASFVGVDTVVLSKITAKRQP